MAVTWNPLGMVILGDDAHPDAWGGRAIAAVSGGQFAFAGSKAAAVGSQAASFGNGDIFVNVSASGTNYPIGIIMTETGSNTEATFYRKGTFIVKCDGAVNASSKVASNNGTDAVSVVGSNAEPQLAIGRTLGTTYTGASSGGFVIMRLDI